MLTSALRLLLGHQAKPFRFKKEIGFLPNFDVPNMGLYVHIPFCKELCPFCPYYKIKERAGLTGKFFEALLSEIDFVTEKIPSAGEKRKVTSLYFGGGSPAIMIDYLSAIRKKIDENFMVCGDVGVELHPRDINQDTSKKLQDAGFDMVSIGIQSFSKRLLHNLGRKSSDYDNLFEALRNGSFKAIDVDLIFGIPEQTEDDLRSDFLLAIKLGATQISTYPFIDFSYATNAKKPLNHREKRMMLDMLIAVAEEAGFRRTSVWTFGRKDAPRYSSITRDCFLGFGPSAASLGLDSLKVNTFSVDEYIKSIQNKVVPTALKMPFTARSRRLYWLFWNCYNGLLSEEEYRVLFGSELKTDFSYWLLFGEILNVLTRNNSGWALTENGSYKFHRIEQLYTRQYIDKTWNAALKNPWPDEILLL